MLHEEDCQLRLPCNLLSWCWLIDSLSEVFSRVILKVETIRIQCVVVVGIRGLFRFKLN